MYKGKKISLVFPAFNEEENIGRAISDFRALRVVDEIIVVDNNSKDKTSKIAVRKKAKVIKENKQGYGFALRRGLSEAKGDYIALCEPDGTFVAKDLLKLLERMDNYDIVMGSRTNKKYIFYNANMGGLLRLGNIALAKVIQILYRPSCYISDCGCTFRVIKKPIVAKLLPKFTVGGSHFLAEFLVIALLSRFNILEIPVRYRKRIGKSKITGSLKKSIIVGFQMLKITLKYRVITG